MRLSSYKSAYAKLHWEFCDNRNAMLGWAKPNEIKVLQFEIIMSLVTIICIIWCTYYFSIEGKGTLVYGSTAKPCI